MILCFCIFLWGFSTLLFPSAGAVSHSLNKTQLFFPALPVSSLTSEEGNSLEGKKTHLCPQSCMLCVHS